MSAIDEWIELLCVTVETFGVERPSIEAGRARFPLRGCTAAVYRGRVDDKWRVELLDMSSSGAGLISPLELTNGERFALRLDAAGPGERVWEMMVVWSTRRADGTFRIGAKRLDVAGSQLTSGFTEL